MTDWGGVLEESIVLDGEVVGGERFAQTLTTLKQFLQKNIFCWFIFWEKAKDSNTQKYSVAHW